MVHRETLYGKYQIKKAVPYKEGNKVIVTLYFDNDITIEVEKKQRFSNSFIVDLRKIPEGVTRIDFFYKQKGHQKIKIAEYKIK